MDNDWSIYDFYQYIEEGSLHQTTLGTPQVQLQSLRLCIVPIKFTVTCLGFNIGS